MLNIVLHQPEIPPNTGNIIRLCANTDMTLHLIKPLGFILNDKQLIRAGLDYHEFANIKIHENWQTCIRQLDKNRIFAATTKGTTRYDKIQYTPGDTLLFGAETCGLPPPLLDSIPEKNRIRVPMIPASRSLNLSNTVAIVVYEAWRQNNFINGA